MGNRFTARHPRLERTVTAAVAACAALLFVVWLAPRASGSAATWLRTPPVALTTLAAPGGRLAVAPATGRSAAAPVTLDAGRTFTMAGVFCDRPPAGDVTIHVRTSLDGAAWGHWYEAPLEVADDAGAARAFIDPIWTGAGRYVQVSATAGTPRAPTALSGVRLVAIDPTGGSSVAERVTGTVRRVAAVVAGVSFDQPARAVTAQPVIVTRAAWGADESLRSGSPSYAPVKMAFIHHTASGNTYTQADAPALVRGIYAYHTEALHWSDIGYNFLIDRFGTIYEGRFGGVAQGVVGAQVGGFNTGSTGISLLGTFSDVAPSPQAVAALERLLAWKLSVSGVSPTGTATLTCGLDDKYKVGDVVTFPTIAGHRDANYTECPGDQLYALLPAIRKAVASRMGASFVPKLHVSTTLVSPNGDGVLDTVAFTVAVPAAADWQLVLHNAAGRAVASWSGQGGGTVTWNGASAGKTVSDGAYTAEVTAGAYGASATAGFTVDTTAPRLTVAGAARHAFSPNGDGQDDTDKVDYAPAEPCSVRVSVISPGGSVLRWLQGWHAETTSTHRLAWDGRITSGASLVPAPDGPYRFRVERRDAAGNIARQGIDVVVDRTVGFPSAAPATFSPNGDGALDRTTLAFKLTRTASVTASVVVDGQVVRTLTLGTLAAGARSVSWDGRDDAGACVTSCRPVVTITASSTLGDSSVAEGLVVDLYRPHVYASGARSTTPGVSITLGVKVTDPYSPTADTSYVVTDAKGRTVRSGHPGALTTGRSLSVSWKPASRGAYTVTWHATDTAGNHEAAPGVTTVTVR